MQITMALADETRVVTDDQQLLQTLYFVTQPPAAPPDRFAACIIPSRLQALACVVQQNAPGPARLKIARHAWQRRMACRQGIAKSHDLLDRHVAVFQQDAKLTCRVELTHSHREFRRLSGAIHLQSGSATDYRTDIDVQLRSKALVKRQLLAAKELALRQRREVQE